MNRAMDKVKVWMLVCMMLVTAYKTPTTAEHHRLTNYVHLISGHRNTITLTSDFTLPTGQRIHYANRIPPER